MWHIDAEIIALLFLLALMLDIGKVKKSEVMRDRLFRVLAATTVVAILFDIVSSCAMNLYESVSWWFIQGSLMGYFIVTPLLSALWFCYSLTIAYKPSKKLSAIMLVASLPFAAFVVIVLSNPFSGLFFSLSAANEYARGALFDSLFYMFYGYSLLSLMVAAINFKKSERATAITLSLFPIIAGGGIYLQQIFSSYLITGAAFTLVLFITYIFLQNRKLTRDSLTGIWNRTAFLNAVQSLSRENESGYVIAVSIENFKLVNRTFGQNIGDSLLQLVGAHLVSVSPSKTCYRYGGDIFALIFRKTSEQECAAYIKKILERFKSSFEIGGVEYSVSVAVGAVAYPYTSEDKNGSIVDALDFVIYEIKKKNKGHIVFHNETLIKGFKRQHDIMRAIDYAIENNTFEVYIQPIYNVKEKRYDFGEALLRLNDPVLSFVPPSEFIPLAEKNGQIVEITYQIMEKVCKFLQENRFVLRDKFAVSVNFSVIQFMQSDVAQRVVQIMENYKILRGLIKIEITESVVADSFEDINQTMQILSNHGIPFALDDYGQGYSNMSYLINLPILFVKLDKCIIDNVVKDSRTISAIIPMFRSLEKIIVAEGVESAEQADVLKQLNCNHIQGYYYAKPMPMKDCIDFLQKNNRLPGDEKLTDRIST